MYDNRDEIKEKIKANINFKDKFRAYYPDLYRSTGNSFNPFIEDKNPSFGLFDDHGCDFGYGNKHYDVFDLYELKYGCDFKTAFDALRVEAGIPDPLKKSQATVPKKDIVEVYNYQDENRQLLYQNVRYEPKDFRLRRPDPDKPEKWIWDLKGIKRVPFKLSELLAAPNDRPVFVCEGEKDALAMIDLGFVATSVGSASTGCGTLEKDGAVSYFKGKAVILVADKDDNGRKYVKKAAPIYAKAANSIKIIEMPGEGIKDPADFYEKHGAAGKGTIELIVADAAEYSPETDKAEKDQPKEAVDQLSNPSKLTKFQKLDLCFQGLGWKLFFDQEGLPWATVQINGHFENLEVNGAQFNRLFQKEVKAQFYDGVGPIQIEQVTGALLGEIEKFQDPRPLHVRKCWNSEKNKVLIDSGRPDCAIFEIGPDGWRWIYTDENPFKRARKTAAYTCTPETPRATWDNLFEFLRVKTEDQKTIIKMWLCLALFPDTARPGLVINGPAGSAKTTLAMKLKQIVDPSTSEKPNRLRKNEDDMIAPLANYAVTVLDNATHMTQEQSDLLCQSITGLDDEKRKFFSQGDTHSTAFMVTWIITGVSNPGKMSDFLSRVFILETEIIPNNEKIPDDKINELSQKHTAGVQALIFDCMSQALRNVNSIKTDELNRLAQANLYSLAMADALGLTQEQITEVWSKNREEQQAEVSTGEILTELIPAFLRSKKGWWEGTANELLEDMSSALDIGNKSGKKSYPSTAVHLGRRLNAIIENLLEQGIVVRKKEGNSRIRQIWNSCVYQENPFENKHEGAGKRITQPSLLNQDTKCGARDDTTDPTCNGCKHYEGHDYCGYSGKVADPHNCPIDNHPLTPTGLKETIATC